MNGQKKTIKCQTVNLKLNQIVSQARKTVSSFYKPKQQVKYENRQVTLQKNKQTAKILQRLKQQKKQDFQKDNNSYNFVIQCLGTQILQKKIHKQQIILEHLNSIAQVKSQLDYLKQIGFSTKKAISIGSKAYSYEDLTNKLTYQSVAKNAGLVSITVQSIKLKHNIIRIGANQSAFEVIIDKDLTVNRQYNKFQNKRFNSVACFNFGKDQLSAHKFLDNQKYNQILDKVSERDPTGRSLMLIYNQIMNQPIKEELKINHQIVKKQMLSEIAKKETYGKHLLYIIMLCLQKQLKSLSKQTEVVFSKKPSLESNIAIRLLSLGYPFSKKKCTQTLQTNKENQKLINSINKVLENETQKNVSEFESLYKDRISNKYKIKKQIIHVFSACKDPYSVDFEILRSAPPQAGQQPDPQFLGDKNIKLHPYFQKFQLSFDDFDKRGDIKFFQSKSNVQFRGGWPYYQPIQCQRFGLRVWDRFDNKNNNWLTMTNSQGQWVSVFHGMQAPDKKSWKFKHQCDTDLNNIVQGLRAGQGILPGKINAYASDKSLNLNQTIGNGIYCTPHMNVALGYSNPVSIFQNDQEQRYCLVFQCRANPKAIHITSHQQYWVVRKQSDMRPYGIILVKEEVKRQYPRPEQQFKEKFTYQKYKQRIDKTQRS